MVIPHIRTTFPASAMFQVDGGDEDELALLFAEDLSINATGAKEDSIASPNHRCQPEENEEPYIIPDLEVNEVIVEIEGKAEMSSLPALTNEEEEEQIKPPPTNDLNVTTTVEKEEGQTKPPPTNDLNISNTTNEDEEQAELPPAKSLDNNTTAKEVQTDPQVEELSINAITTEGDSTTLPICHCQQGEEAKMWTNVPLL
jgi:hypothetical protein